MEYSHHTAGCCDKYTCSAFPWGWLLLGVTTIFGPGLASECSAFTVSPTALTFKTVQGATDPPSQTLSVYRKRTSQTTVTNSDNATWLAVSPVTTSMTTSSQLTIAVNANGLAAGTYNATVTIRVGTRSTTTIPVTLTVSSPQPLPSATTATLAWNPVMDPTLTGYNVHVGTASGLYTRTIAVGNVTSYNVDSLATGTTYYFSVTAYNSAGQSPHSNEVSKSIY